jgi:undecaprenyl-diphosphatase
VAVSEVDDVEVDLSPLDRIRSPDDLMQLLTGLAITAVGLAAAVFARNTLGGAERDLAETLSRIPSRWEQVILSLTEVTVATAATAAVIWLLASRRLRDLGWLLVTVVSASVMMFAVDWTLSRYRVEVLRGVDSGQEWLLADPGFPSSGLIAAITAAAVFGAPWLTRRGRQAAWIGIGTLILMRVGFSADPSVDVIAAVGVGMVVGSAVLLWRGAPSIEPAGEQLVVALRSVGIEPRRVRQVTAADTSLTYLVDNADGRVLRLELRTPHQRSADALSRLWQSIRLRSRDVDEPFNSLAHQVEHEALALTMASRAGARVPDVVTMVATPDGCIGIAEVDIDGIPADQDPGLLDRATLADMWDQIRLLHRGRIAHRDLGVRRYRLDGAHRSWLTGFRRARLVADEREQCLDIAQLLTDSAVHVEEDLAVQSAVDALGDERAARAIPFLQPLALPSATRRALKGHPGLLDRLRDLVQQRTGAPEVPLERIERVRPRTVVTVVAVTMAFYLVLPQLADIRSTADAFVRADWGWAPWILVGSALTYVFAAVAFIGAVPSPVAYLPALRAQVASSFVALVAPASSGSLALGVRFLQRTGVDAAPAAAAVGLNTLAGLVVHLALMLVFLLWNGRSGLGSFSFPDATLLLGGLAVLLVLIGLAMLNRSLRRRVLSPLVAAVRSAVSSVGETLTNPVRIVELFAGSLGITLAYLLAMVAAVEAFGGGPRFTQIAVGYLVAAALASIAPTPGGLGAFEATMITALTGFGMPSGAAVSATLAFRLATYWLPVLPGWLSFLWMQHHEEI